MSEANAQEPTMEEILASIRRIISEDDAPAAAEAEAAHAEPHAEPHDEEAAPPPAAAEAPPPPPPPPKADVLELTQRVAPEPAPAPRMEAPLPPSGDIDFTDAPAPKASAPAPAPQPAPSKAPAGGSLVSDTAATAAAGHFGQLAQQVAAPPSGRSLEEFVGEMLRPMLKAWLDEHLPKIVEASVQSEVERISRRGY